MFYYLSSQCRICYERSGSVELFSGYCCHLYQKWSFSLSTKICRRDIRAGGNDCLQTLPHTRHTNFRPVCSKRECALLDQCQLEHKHLEPELRCRTIKRDEHPRHLVALPPVVDGHSKGRWDKNMVGWPTAEGPTRPKVGNSRPAAAVEVAAGCDCLHHGHRGSAGCVGCFHPDFCQCSSYPYCLNSCSDLSPIAIHYCSNYQYWNS